MYIYYVQQTSRSKQQTLNDNSPDLPFPNSIKHTYMQNNNNTQIVLGWNSPNTTNSYSTHYAQTDTVQPQILSELWTRITSHKYKTKSTSSIDIHSQFVVHSRDA
jgi:hypothetical protein